MARKAKIKSSPVLSARDLLNGFVAGNNDFNLYSMTPIQMVPMCDKDEEWKKWNLDWFERAGIQQLSKCSKKITKNYYLANGIIDKSDYVIGAENDMSDTISVIAPGQDEALPIKFFPIIPNVINVLCGEFSKRDQRIIVNAVDDMTIKEAYEYKKDMLTQVLVQRAIAKKEEQLASMGMDFQDPQQQEQIQSELDAAKQLAEVELKFKSYRSIPEKWANHMIQLDNQRFNMYELEGRAFRDMLISDREFWHISVKEDDYSVELWEPWNTFYHKSPTVDYISEGNYVGRIRTMSLADVIDTYGSKMKDEQILSLKQQYQSITNSPMLPDQYRSQENFYTDYSKPYPKNYTNVTWQKYIDGKFANVLNGKEEPLESNMSWSDIDRAGRYEQLLDMNGPGSVRVTEVYWKSQKKVFELTWIKDDGTIIKDIVDENYKKTFEPVYNTMLNEVKSKDNLVKGEHLEAIWINEVRWGVKINSGMTNQYSRNYSDPEPVYIGGDPIPFQFKGQNNLYGCKLPVEGKVFSERGSQSSSIVDKMKPGQISFNIVNNQIVEFLADEIGNVLVVDQNTIPRNSMGGSWGANNVPQFHRIMKDYQTALIDPSIQNMGSATNFAHFQSVDLTKTAQIMSRIELAQYFKNEAFSVVGITPQRLGSVTASETATGTQQAVNNSYAQTEPYYNEHMNYLMPRVRQMMLDAAQFIAATKPQTRQAYLNSEEQNVFFDIEGYQLLLRDFRIKAMSTANIKELRNKLEQLAMQTIPAGGSIVDAAKMIAMQSPSEIVHALETAEDKRNQEVQAQRQHEQEMQQAQQQFMEQQEAKALENENYWKERIIQKDIVVAQIKAAQSKDNDVDANSIPDPLEVNRFLHEQGLDAQDSFFRSQEMVDKRQQRQADLADRQAERELKREEMRSKEKIEKMKLANPVSGERKKK